MLRGSTGDRLLVTRPPGYLLRVGPEQLDLHRFVRLVDQGRRALAAGAPERAAEHLGEALTLWRGAPLGDLGSESFARGEVERLANLRHDALEERIEAERGRRTASVRDLRRRLLAHLGVTAPSGSYTDAVAGAGAGLLEAAE